MARAGKALRQVLQTYGISQNKVAVAMGINRSTLNQWVHEVSDPKADSIPDIVAALRSLDEAAADEFLRLYLGG